MRYAASNHGLDAPDRTLSAATLSPESELIAGLETTGTGVTTPAHAAIPGTEHVAPCGHGG